jgi:hypothetical protein
MPRLAIPANTLRQMFLTWPMGSRYNTRGDGTRRQMCGRFLNKLPAAEIARIFGTKNALPNYPARFTIAPTRPVLRVQFNPRVANAMS